MSAPLVAEITALARECIAYIQDDALIDAEPSFGCPERSETNACTLTYPHTFHECWEEGSDLPRRPPLTVAPDVMTRWERARVLRYLSWRLGCEAESAEGEFKPCRHCGKSSVEECECPPF